MRRHTRLASLAAVLALAAATSSALAQVGTAVSYQGQLKSSGIAVNSASDLRFSLWTDPNVGTQVGTTDTRSGVPVSAGLFSTTFDCGINPYASDQALWLKVEVRNPAGSGSFIPLEARQRITPAPFSAATRGLNVNAGNRVGILANPFVTNDVSLTLGSAGGGFPSASILFENRAGGGNWAVSAFDDADSYGDYTLSRSGTDFPFVIRGDSSNILLNSGGTGNVGIGTTTPTNRLTIGPGSGLYPPAGIGLLPSTDAVSERAAIDVDNWALVQDITGDGTRNFSIYERSVDGHRLSITPGGNVGIGTTTPSTRLDVNGDAHLSGRVGILANPYFTNDVSLTIGSAGGAFPSANILLENGAGGGNWSISAFDNGGGYGDFTLSRSGLDFPLIIKGNTGNMSLSTAPSAFKLDVGGNIRCVALTQTSAREFKQDILPLTGALESIMKLRGVSYAWNDQAPAQVRGAHDIGFLADEMNAVLPDIVAKDENGKPIGIDYGKVTPVAVEAIKQLKVENDRMKADNAELRARLDRIEALLAARRDAASK